MDLKVRYAWTKIALQDHIMLIDRHLYEDVIEKNKPMAKYLGSNIHSAADVNIKHILAASSFLWQRIGLVSPDTS